MKRKMMTPDMAAEAVRLRRRNWTCADIAAKLGVSRGCVQYHMVQEGIEPAKPRRLSATPATPTVFVRNGRVVRRFTGAEDAALRKLVELKWTDLAIARALGRQPNSVRARRQALRRRLARAATAGDGAVCRA